MTGYALQRIKIKLYQIVLHKQCACTKCVTLGLLLSFGSLFPALHCQANPSEPPAKHAEEAIVLEKLIVSARGSATPISQTPGGVGIVNDTTIFQAQPVSISNALQRISGVNKTSDSLWGSEVSIRGLSRNRVIFLIDGCRVNTATDLNAQFGLLHPDEIERIEVLKGPVSALYGSGSIGGVVNVITKKGTFSPEPSFHASFTVTHQSNPEGYSTHTSLMHTAPNHWVYASGSLRDHDSYKDGDGAEVHNSQFDDMGGSIKTGFRWNELHQTVFQFQYIKGNEIGIPGKGEASMPAVADVTYRDISREMMSIHHSFTPHQYAWKRSDISFFHQKIDRDVRIDQMPPAGAVASLNPSASHTTWGMKWINEIETGKHDLALGMDIWEWEMKSTRKRNFRNGTTGIDNPLADSKQFSGGIFAEDMWALSPNLTLNFGGRLDFLRADSKDHYQWILPPAPNTENPLIRTEDDYHDFSWNFHAGLAWRFIPQWSMTFLAASSYRAPDLMERFKYIDLGQYAVYGNRDLDPERSRFFEYGLHHTTSRINASISAFFNEVDDLIVEKRISDQRHEMQNIETARIYGSEAEIEWHFMEDWTAYGHVAWLRGKNRTENQDLDNIYPFNGLAGIRRTASSGLNGHMEAVWAARQSEVAPDERKTPGWLTLNTGISYSMPFAGSFHELALTANNLLDATYRDHLSTGRKPALLNEPGRNIVITYRVIF
ncbi:TonB-dependent receptor [Desulfobotulus sp. H1]|uniref:TonB-dependent receptor n=1 Tax=Desulfobotulus pelophilus TaxID=2823377 RepID=A0ABT3NA58_9BACT|nr:TonB-dependent receptor [Desulfobotulus pelophilus]MCW7754339.1 TonB-dependent receptor [Desulfobotulus pelophilus]